MRLRHRRWRRPTAASRRRGGRASRRRGSQVPRSPGRSSPPSRTAARRRGSGRASRRRAGAASPATTDACRVAPPWTGAGRASPATAAAYSAASSGWMTTWIPATCGWRANASTAWRRTATPPTERYCLGTPSPARTPRPPATMRAWTITRALYPAARRQQGAPSLRRRIDTDRRPGQPRRFDRGAVHAPDFRCHRPRRGDARGGRPRPVGDRADRRIPQRLRCRRHEGGGGAVRQGRHHDHRRAAAVSLDRAGGVERPGRPTSANMSRRRARPAARSSSARRRGSRSARRRPTSSARRTIPSSSTARRWSRTGR